MIIYTVCYHVSDNQRLWQIYQRNSTSPSLSLCRTSFHFSIIKIRQCWCMILAKTAMLIWDKFIKVAAYLIKHTSYNYCKNSEKNTDQAIIFCIVFSFELRDSQLFLGLVEKQLNNEKKLFVFSAKNILGKNIAISTCFSWIQVIYIIHNTFFSDKKRNKIYILLFFTNLMHYDNICIFL